MNKLFVAFLWHMHQPMYKDPLSGDYILPWVRLHSIKGYNDMLSILEGFPAIRQTFNLVPSLMMQIQEYVDGTAKDIFYELSKKPAAELTPDERAFILENFFAANWDTMVLIYPRYRELLQKRGRRATREELRQKQASFSEKDMRDLQVWFNLTWFGHAARNADPELKKLMQRRSGFSEDEKLNVLDKQVNLLRSLLPRYRKAQESGQIEISVSPFYHPILPLLCDFESAREAMPDIKLPKHPFRHPEDARRQVTDAISYYDTVFGRRPRGMWPSEGSVSDEVAGVIAGAGIEWAATDEEILLNTIQSRRRAEIIYTPYCLELAHGDLNLVFRDKSLSDLIGFSYSKSDPQAAAEDLVGHLNNIHATLSASAGEHIVSIILDGENAWEYYADGGKLFLSKLYSLLSESDRLETTTIGDYLERFPPRMNLKRIYSGSWISHNFNIWIGRREENLAWDMLARTRAYLERQQNRTDISSESWDAAYDAMSAAEGSDWFWWYGDDFTSSFESEFDRLFRSHLMQVYRALGDKIPSYLGEPIVHAGAVRPTEQPTGLLSPAIDGLVTHFYEWVAAGSFDVGRSSGAMNVSEPCLSRIYWGFDLSTFFLRLDTSSSPLGEEFLDVNMAIHMDGKKHHRFDLIFPDSPDGTGRIMIYENTDAETWTQIAESDRLGVDKIIEIAVDFDSLDLTATDEVKFHVRVNKGPIEIERWPRSGYIEFSVPGEEFEASMWYV